MKRTLKLEGTFPELFAYAGGKVRQYRDATGGEDPSKTVLKFSPYSRVGRDAARKLFKPVLDVEVIDGKYHQIAVLPTDTFNKLMEGGETFAVFAEEAEFNPLEVEAEETGAEEETETEETEEDETDLN